jgi:hypothetical protein
MDIDGDSRVIDISGKGDGTNDVDMGAHEFHLPVNNLQKDTWYISIQSAINDASNGNQIIVYPGTYYENVTINKPLILCGKNPNSWHIVENTIIDANYNGTAVCIANQDTTLSGFTIRNGSYYGVYSGSYGTIRINNCIIKNNGQDGINGSGLGTTLINNNIIYGHSTAGINLCMLLDSLSITNNMIYDNFSGILLSEDYAYINSVQNNTIVGSSYGIISATADDPNIRNCIIWDCVDDLWYCTAAFSCIQNPNDAYGFGNITSDPLFINADANDFHLTLNSPCIDIGDPNLSYSGQTDIDGDDRVIDISGKGDGNVDVDMGADE